MKRLHLIQTVVAASLVGLATPALAEEAPEGGGGFTVDWWTVDGGGGLSSGGGFAVTGTIGQADAGTSSGGDWTVSGGFWSGGPVDTPPPCPEDLDGSGAVDFGDLLAVLSAFGDCPGCPEDLDGNNAVDFSDLLTVLSAWGPCP